MPIYEYRCPRCEHELEMIRSSSERDNEIECPACKESKLERKLSIFSSKCCNLGAPKPGGFS